MDIKSILIVVFMRGTSASQDDSHCCPPGSLFHYCDSYEGRCISCSQVCRSDAGANDWDNCHTHCPSYLREVVKVHTVTEVGDIKTLTVMVGVTAAMTSIVLIALFVLISLKLDKRKKRKIGMSPTSVSYSNKEVIKMEVGSKSDNSDGNESKLVPSSLKTGTSLQTVVTQLSEESSGSPPTNSINVSRRGGGRRLPSESCVGEVSGRCNISSNPGEPYTISHSQVI